MYCEFETKPVQLGQLETGADVKGLLQSHLWCPKAGRAEKENIRYIIFHCDNKWTDGLTFTAIYKVFQSYPDEFVMTKPRKQRRYSTSRIVHTKLYIWQKESIIGL